MPIKISEITVSKLRGYRDFAFPAALSVSSHVPFFSLEFPEDWVSDSGYELYETWLKNANNISLDLGSNDRVGNATLGEIKKYRDVLITSKYAHDPYFSADNAQEWIKPVAFEAWMMWFKQATSAQVRSSSRMSSASVSSVSRSPSRMSETSDFARDELDTASQSRASIPPSSRRSSSAADSVPNFREGSAIGLSDDEDFELTSFVRGRTGETKAVGNYRYRTKSEPLEEVLLPNKRPRSRSSEKQVPESQDPESAPGPSTSAPSEIKKKPTKKAKSSGQIKITTKLFVDRLEVRNTVPHTWTVPRDNAATLLDLSEMEAIPTRQNGGNMSIDAYIRQEDQDSWTGTSGHSVGDARVYAFYEGEPTRFEKSRRVQLQCNGINTCQFFDQSILEGHQRFEPDIQEMQTLWNHELDANAREAGSASSVIVRFYTRVMRLKCSVKCQGKPVMRLRGQGPSKHGKLYFIGCSGWKPSEKDGHRYLAIPYNIDEDILQYVMDNNGALPTDTAPNDKCVLALHPRVSQKTCPYSHVVNGVISGGEIVNRKCPTQMIIYTPLDSSIHKAIVVLRNPHNHPMHPRVKPSIDDRRKLSQAIMAAGLEGLTVQKLLNAPSTAAVYGGKSLVIESPAFMDRRKLRDAVNEKQKELYPHGNGLKGLFHAFFNQEQQLPVSERYIQAVMSTGDTQWIFTMHPRLAKYIHGVLYLCVDYTFKRVKGDVNEWEVVGFIDSLKRRVTFARFYCDRNTKTAFSRLWGELFRLIPELTGSILKFSAFFPGDPTARLRAIILDAEAPQAQGLQEELLAYLAKYAPDFFKFHSGSNTDILLMVLKTCTIHFERNIDKLPVSPEVKSRLKSFMGLKNEIDIAEWHNFVKSVPDKSVQDWYQQKLNYPWLLPSLNRFLSKMDKESWDTTPVHTNLAEGGHSGTNAITSISKEIGQAVESARQLDAKIANELEAMETLGVLPKRWNGPMEREHRADKRQAWSHAKQQKRDEEVREFESLQAQQNTLSAQKSASLALGKKIQEEINSLKTDDPDYKQKRQDLQAQIKLEKEKRSAWTASISKIKNSMQVLKENGLKGRRINAHQSSGAVSEAGVDDLQDLTPVAGSVTSTDGAEVLNSEPVISHEAMESQAENDLVDVMTDNVNSPAAYPAVGLQAEDLLDHSAYDSSNAPLVCTTTPTRVPTFSQPATPSSRWMTGAADFVNALNFDTDAFDAYVFMSPEKEASVQQALEALRGSNLTFPSTSNDESHSYNLAMNGNELS